MSKVYEREVEDGVFEDVETFCAELVPMTQSVYRAAKLTLTRPDAGFLTQLIATAEELPQARKLRRVSPSEVLSAYRAFAQSRQGAGLSKRQTI